MSADRETYFSILGVPEKFQQDRALLQKNFYDASRVLHPDRFTTSDSQAKQDSLERMSLLNEAYRTLRNPAELRDYMLEIHDLKPEATARGQVPMQLAESWFDLQDSLAEDPDQAEHKLKAFENELKAFRDEVSDRIKLHEADFDAASTSTSREAILKKLSKDIQELSYLKSMDRDVERIKAKWKS